MEMGGRDSGQSDRVATGASGEDWDKRRSQTLGECFFYLTSGPCGREREKGDVEREGERRKRKVYVCVYLQS